ncbi:MAG TPA: SDR family oxidoreductase [Acidimicrobiales bacterium]|nr:SDR family oxidoreductase [Acidimicrobiales bacterium]
MSDEHVQVLTGTSVVVTGGARGLGRAMTEALALAGASVLVVDIDEEPIIEVMTEVHGRVIGHQADISSENQVEEIVKRCISIFGSIDVVINNAGIGLSAIRPGDRYANPVRFWELDRHWMQRFFEVHVMGPFYLSKVALESMRAQGFGRIVTVTTSLATMLGGGNAPYGMMKAASEALCSSMAQDLEGSKITANILIPGGASNTRYVPVIAGRSRDDLVQPVVMGAPAVFLASGASESVNARRIIAKLWDPTLSDEENLERASAPIGWPTR